MYHSSIMLNDTILVLAIATVAIISPGPDFLLISRATVRDGLRSGAGVASGVLTGVTIQIAGCVLGISVLLAARPELLALLQKLGALYLAYLGYVLLRSAARAGEPDPDSKSPLLGNYTLGLLTNLTNPKFTIFILSIFGQVVHASSGIGERLYFGALVLVHAAVYWFGLVLLLDRDRVRRFFAEYRRGIDGCCGAALLVLAVVGFFG